MVFQLHFSNTYSSLNHVPNFLEKVMRFFLISLLSLFFLSGCGGKDPAEEFIGEWKQMGKPTDGLVINSDKTGFFYYEGRLVSFTWDYEEDALHEIAIKATYEDGSASKLSLSGGRITNQQPKTTTTYIYERSK